MSDRDRQPAEAEGDPLIGEIVADRYLIRELLGVGGMGRVYRAVQLDLERPVALKFLDHDLGLNSRQVERFHQEALAASRLDHPGVAMIHDHGEWEDRRYLVMELLRGQSLYQLTKQEGPLTYGRVVAILAQVCDVLEEAHDAGLVHRDMKPENIMVTKGRRGTERVKVVDFGLASMMWQYTRDREEGPLTISGTPFYMSPEQCRGAVVDHRSDIYALGVILYELIAGRPPFVDPQPAKVLLGHLYANPPTINAPYAHPATASLEVLCRDALAKVPDQRPQSAALFRDRMLVALGLLPEQVDDPVSGSSWREAELPTLNTNMPAAQGVNSPGRVLIFASNEDTGHTLADVLQAAGYQAEVGDPEDASVQGPGKSGLQARILELDGEEPV